ncbi:MAG TPA: flagellin [Patescibacteria group bacterium]|nr:flagellin [Patescibacteria group bacterium]
MIINHNLVGETAYNLYKGNVSKNQKALKHLSSGLAINQASDNAAGLAISEKMRSAIRGLQQAGRNAQDGISMLQTAEGGLNENQAVLQRMRELSVQAATDSLTSDDREEIQKEIEQLKDQLDTVAQTTEFNTKKLLDGTASVLYSVSDNRLKVMVDGAVRSIDKYGNATSLEGNYKLSVETTAGKGEIQTSNSLQQINGNVGINYDQTQAGAYTGLTNISAEGLAESNYRIATRETPYGGITYANNAGGAITSAAISGTLGVDSITTTANPNILPNGTYNVDVANELPFMATFADSATGADVVHGVNRTNYGDIDVNMDVTGGIAAANTAASALDWSAINPPQTIDIDTGGGYIAPPTLNTSFQTDGTSTNNLYTNFDVTGTDTRDLLASQVNAVSYYRSSAASHIDMTLSYRSATGDTVDAQATYYSQAAQSTSFSSTYRFNAGETLTVYNTVTSASVTVTFVGGEDMNAARLALSAVVPGGMATFATAAVGGQTRINVTNTSGAALTLGGTARAALGWGAGLAIGATSTGTLLDTGAVYAVAGLGGQDITQVAATMTADADMVARGITAAAVTAGGEGHLNIVNGSTHYDVVFETDPTGVEGELGFSNAVVARGATWDGLANGGVSVFHQRNILAIGVGNQNIAGVAAAIQTAVTGVSTSTGDTIAFTATAASGGGDLLHVAYGNTSKYRVTVSNNTGTTATEMGLASAVTERTGTYTGVNLYNNHVVDVDVSNRYVDAIETQLSNAIVAAVNSDGTALNNGRDAFTLAAAGTTRSINVNNTGATNTFYDITLANHAGGSVMTNELWAGGFSVLRNATDSSGIARDFGAAMGSITAGSTIEEALTSLDAMGFTNTVGWTDAAHTPGYDGTHHLGQVTVANNESTLVTRREIIFQAGAGTAQLFGVGGGTSVTLANNGTVNTVNNWQARDNVSVNITQTGIDNNGNTIAATTTNYTFWEGDSGAYNATTIAPGLGFSEIFFKDTNDKSTELINTDSWTVFTQAATAGNQDELDFTLYNQATGLTSTNTGGTLGGMHFNNGALDGRTLTLPQMIRTTVGYPATYGVVNHSVEFGTNIVTTGSALRYNERYASPTSFDYYAHAAPLSSSSTYFFGNGQNLTTNVPAATVWRQEDDNCSLLFTVNADGTLAVQGKGYNRNGSVNDFSATITMPTVSGAVTVGRIQFDNLKVSSSLATGDKFVINVVARAGGPGNGYYGTGTDSDASIAITGDPWSNGNSTMEYRFDQGAEDGQTFNTLGWFVDPVNGSDPEVGVWTGQINVAVSATGFVAGNRWGTDNAHLDINYVGTTDHIAAAVTTGYFFQQKGRNEPLVNIIDTIQYDVNSTQNASAMFEVLGVVNGSVMLRGQAHIYDKSGNYRYDYEEYFSLGGNNDNITLFKDENGANGLTFTKFNFTDASRLSKGDKFSLFMSANSEPAISTDDEVMLFTQGDKRNMYPMGWRFLDGVMDNSTTPLRTFQVDFDSGKVYDGEVKLTFADYNGGTASGVVGNSGTPNVVQNAIKFQSTYKTGVGLGTAHMYTALKDIRQFWDNSGNYLLDTPQSVQVSSNGKTSTLMLYGSDTVIDVMDKLNAILYDGFDQKDILKSADQYKLVSYVDENADTSGKVFGTTDGTMVLRSAVAGDSGDIVFRGNDALLNALGMQVVRESENNEYSVNITNADTGAVIAQGDQAIGGLYTGTSLGDNLKVKLDGTVGLDSASYDQISDDIKMAAVTEDMILHLTDVAPTLQIGAGQNQSMVLSLGDISAEGLGLKDILVSNRVEANKSLGLLDDAITKVSSMRANLGAVQNRLTHTMDNLSSMQENLTAAESRIRDVDMAKEMMDFTKTNIMLNASYSIMSQAQQIPGRVMELLK